MLPCGLCHLGCSQRALRVCFLLQSLTKEVGYASKPKARSLGLTEFPPPSTSFPGVSGVLALFCKMLERLCKSFQRATRWVPECLP